MMLYYIITFGFMLIGQAVSGTPDALRHGDEAAVDDVVAEHQQDPVAAHEVGPDDERLGDAARLVLGGVGQLVADTENRAE